MKNCLVLFFSFCCFILTTSGYSQSKFGNATMEELNMSVYPEDTTATAVILLKNGDISFKYTELHGFQFEYTIQVKIKILKTEGLEWCNHQIPYYQASSSDKEDILGLSGTTYNIEDGKITKTKLSKEFIFEEESDEKWKLRKFTMPAAKVGSVIEYKYTIISDFFRDLRDFAYQESIPIAYTTFEAVIPEYFKYNINYQGYENISTVREPANTSFFIKYRDENGRPRTENIRCNAEKIKGKGINIPAIKDENFLWTVKDYITKISFELKNIQMPYSMTKDFSSSWATIDKEILQNSRLGNSIKKADLFKNEVAKGELSLDRAKEIQNLVKQKVKWNDKTSVRPSDLKDVLKTGLGNSTDLNVLLINALKAGGFDAHPVILSTRDNGRIPLTHPSISAFNYIITAVAIDTITYFTDASAKYGDWNLLPDKVMVPQARLLLPNGNSEWVDLSQLGNSTIYQLGEYKFVDSKYQGKISDTRKGNTAYDFKRNYFSYKSKDEYAEYLGKNLSSEIEDLTLHDIENTSLPTKIEFTQKTDLALGDDYLYITPVINKIYDENPFKKEERIFPINFKYLTNFIQIVTIDILEGYIAEELPKSERFVLNDNDLSFIYRISQDNDKIKLHCQYQVKKLFFNSTEYADLQDFFAKMVSKNAEQIVLKKAVANN